METFFILILIDFVIINIWALLFILFTQYLITESCVVILTVSHYYFWRYVNNVILLPPLFYLYPNTNSTLTILTLLTTYY